MKLKELLFKVCEIFEDWKVPDALIGGYSAIIYSSPYTTMDIDFVAEPE